MPIKADKSLRAYYNEIDPAAAQWIRNLMAEGWITKGDVDERSIEDVKPNELAGYDRLHFFAGVAVWDYALNQAGWGRGEIWTGSCPCQPFSAAGKGAGFADERHLWPAFNHLIQQCKPDTVLGEQVASQDGLTWLDLVHTDMEAQGYTFGAVDTCSAGFGAPHIRQRLYWVGHTSNSGLDKRIGLIRVLGGTIGASQGKAAERASVHIGRMADNNSNGRQPRCEGCATLGHGQAPGADCGAGGVADAILQQRPDGEPGIGHVDDAVGRIESATTIAGLCSDLRPGPTNGHWRDADWLGCRDGKWRPVEPGTFPLVNGAPSRVVQLRAFGNAINAVQAQGFIEAVMEIAA